VRWTVVIPVKALPAAKSRLAGASADEAAHARLVAALRADTVSAVRGTPQVARVVFVVDDATALAPTDAGTAIVIEQIRPGLNAAVAQGAEHAALEWPADGVAVLVGDLPALRPDELAATLAAAEPYERGYVPDNTGDGTTMLTARPGVRVESQFGPGSAGRHATTAVALPAAPGLRQDVDTAADLRAAVGLGVGPATRTAVTATSLVHLGGR
jgi:2-phospho-L-lactate guanylyltransferase